MRGVSVIGAGLTRFGEHWSQGFRELITEAAVKSIEDAKIEGKEIQAIFGGPSSVKAPAGGPASANMAPATTNARPNISALPVAALVIVTAQLRERCGYAGEALCFEKCSNN